MGRGRRTLASTLGAPRRLGALPAPPPVPAGLPVGEGVPDKAPDLAVAYHDTPPPIARMSAALVAGDDQAARQAYLAHWRIRGEDRTAELDEAGPLALETARRIARAFAHLGRFGPEDLLERGPALGERELRALAHGRSEGDEAERAHLERNRDRARLTSWYLPMTQDELWSRLRALRRMPYRYQVQDVPGPGEPRQVSASVHHSLLIELAAALSSKPEFRGIRVARPRFSPGVRRSASTTPLSLAIVLEAVVDGEPTRLVISASVGDSRATDAEARLKSIRGMVRRNNDALQPLMDQAEGEVEFPTTARIAAPLEPIDAGGLPEMDAEWFYGSDECRHDKSRWLRQGTASTGPDACDALSLYCEDCSRSHIRSVPLHQVEAGHFVIGHLDTPEGEAAYLARQAYHQELAGDLRPIVSIEQLRRRDGVIPLAESEGSERPARTSSLGEALAGRR